ncbi:hypothetical protein GGR54DRAFT_469117 [Hypoxylon sp. NC1633]|nr:hypothetical protein GGR54DRAFT_469117 [Hypoxylon sp. NC1633]
MPDNSSQQRTQFSSCDACRRSRVACDASKLGHEPGDLRWTGSCSRCSLRQRPCTFEWMKNTNRIPSNSRQDVTSHSSTTETNIFGRYEQNHDPPDPLYSHPSFAIDNDIRHLHNAGHRASSGSLNTSIELPRSQARFTDALLSRWSDQIFHHGFDAFLGILLGRNGCPLVDDPTSEVCIPAYKIFRKLDAVMDDELDRQNPDPERRQRDLQIDQSLSQTIRSFVARWLPLVLRGNHPAAQEVDQVVRDSWRSARKDMLKAINRTSYRSVLALYLFAQTPVPTGISKDEELDGVSSLICIQTALSQIQRLRERQQRRKQCGLSDVSTWVDALTSSAASPSYAQAYVDFENRVYWAAVMWDTSLSLTWNLRTSLTSGLNGGCAEPAWRLVRTFLSGSFHSKTEHWRSSNFDISDAVACQIIAAAAISRLYVWKNITSLKEALREGVDEASVLFVWRALLDAIDIFESSIRPLLGKCEKGLYFLDQLNRLGWYGVRLQYYQGILVLANTIETANRFDLLTQITETIRDAEHESLNVLIFGIENTYAINGPGEDTSITPSLDATYSPGESITASLIAIDPYPNHVVDSVLLMNKVIDRKYHHGEIKQEARSYLSSILLKALGQLPQHSKFVQAAQESLQVSLHKDDVIISTHTAVGA